MRSTSPASTTLTLPSVPRAFLVTVRRDGPPSTKPQPRHPHRRSNAIDWFSYLDALIEQLNAEPSGRYHAFYSTPAQYMATKITSNIPLHPYAGDFFPYNDDSAGHNLWTVSER